jgi:hypothetical protein
MIMIRLKLTIITLCVTSFVRFFKPILIEGRKEEIIEI